ncbi:MAG: PDDEXK nuclease domain-containing protein [Oscillospiraceae bacterium]|nr:PDDEXK nuclease domain-containing protein [Oscillospiraceae bacterium]
MVHNEKGEFLVGNISQQEHNYKISETFYSDVRTIIDDARSNAVRSVDFHRVLMYWRVGERIFVEEQRGEERAAYGTYLIKNLERNLKTDYGSGFSVRQLELARQFYRIYPIANALRSQLNWAQYRLLIRIDDDYKREYYELETVHNGWNGRELERQVNSSLYERLLLSNDKEAIRAVARKERIPEKPIEIIKDPMYLEFLGLKREAAYYEKDFESALITHLREFLLELGNGFSFVARQKRILLEDDEFFVDLVFYNRLLRCFVVIEIKTHKITHEDLGQLQMYVNYFDRCEKLPDENPTVGILLCASKNDALVKFSLPEDNANILTSKYELYLPKEADLLDEVKEMLELAEESEGDVF